MFYVNMIDYVKISYSGCVLDTMGPKFQSQYWDLENDRDGR